MKMSRNKMKAGLRAKLFAVIFILVVIAVTAFAVYSIFQFSQFWNLIYDSNMEQDKIISETTNKSMLDYTVDRLQRQVESGADLVDAQFWSMKHDLELLALDVKDVFENPQNYMEKEVKEPDNADAGRLVCQLLYSSDAVKNDEQSLSLIRKIANFEPHMKGIIKEIDWLHDVGVALPEGVTIVCDRHPEDKTDENGRPLYYDPRKKANYNGTVENRKAYFAPMDYDEHHGAYKLSVGVPVYVNGELEAIVGGSRLLSDMGKMISRVGDDISTDSFICLLDDRGDVIFSELKEGDLAYDEDLHNNVFKSSNAELVGFAKKTGKDKKGIETLMIDGKKVYLSYAPLPTVGWTMLLGMPEESMEEPAKGLVAKVDRITEETLDKSSRMSQRARNMLLLQAAILILLSVVTSLRYSRKLVEPIKQLKDAGVRFIEREDTGLEHTHDFFGELNLHTGDEIEDLWKTMRDLERNIANSMHELKDATAEKERIGTELSVAARIQSDMLPKIFPPFPERDEFDLFSLMKPAKEVGGDFYDFFLTDEDHLCLVMADVSGKGVPAALFMMISRTLLKNLALSERKLSPGRVLFEANNKLFENNEECMFVTVWIGYVTISTGELIWANGGHEYPAICRKGGNFEIIEDKHGPGLGTFENMEFEENELRLEPSDILFLYTDGIPEAENTDEEFFGMERMLVSLDKCRGKEDPEEMAALIREEVGLFAGDREQFDDITMTFFVYRG